MPQIPKRLNKRFSMLIIFRFKGDILLEFQLQDKNKEYILGRSDQSDIRITKDFISRKHGKIYYDEGQWYYQDLREDHPHYFAAPQKIEDHASLQIETELELSTNQYLNQYLNTSQTKIIKLKQPKKNGKKNAAIIAATILMAALGFQFKHKFIPMDSQTLLNHVQKRFVEFEMIKDQSLESEFIAKGILKKEDFKAEVGFCSGFIVQPGIVMTASHCLLGTGAISPMTKFSLKTFDKKKHSIDRILGLDISRDLILVEVKSLMDYPHFKFRQSQNIGEQVYTVGNVHGEGMAMRDGTISSFTKDPNNPKIQYLRYTAATSPGNSGGPLVDSYGNVVGLVFARSNAAENYNLSAPYQALNKFMQETLPIREHKIVVNTEELIFGAYLWKHYRNRGLANEALYANNDFFAQEKQDELNKIKFSLNLPQNYKDFKSAVLVQSNKVMTEKMKKIKDELVKEDKLGSTWFSHVNNKHPVLVPRDLNDTLLNFDQLSSDYLWEKNILIIEPGRYIENSADDHKYLVSSVNNVFPKDYDLSKRSIFPHYLRTAVDGYSYSSLFKNETSLVLIDYTAEGPQTIDEDKYKEAFKIEGDFYITPYSINYPFIRPKKMKEFKLSDFNWEPAENIQDKYGRSWRTSQVSLFRDMHMKRYCMDYPQAQMCINKVIKSNDEELIQITEQNFIETNLSEKILDLNFWSVEAMKNYLSSNQTSYEFSDLKLTEKTLSYKHFDLSYKINKDVKQIKVLPAIIKTDEAPKWVIIGHQTYMPKKGKRPATICRSEINFPKLKTSFLADYYHESLKLPKKLATKEGDFGRDLASKSIVNKIKIDTIKTNKWDDDLKVYQACREVLKNDYSEGFFMGDYVSIPEDAF